MTDALLLVIAAELFVGIVLYLCCTPHRPPAEKGSRDVNVNLSVDNHAIFPEWIEDADEEG